MVKVTIIFDNQIAPPLTPIEFVKEYYLSVMGNKDLKYMTVQQLFILSDR